MNAALMSGAYVNAGDFLIERRAIALIKNIFPTIQFNIFKRNEFGNRNKELRQSDVIIFGGGPIFMNKLDNYLGLA